MADVTRILQISQQLLANAESATPHAFEWYEHDIRKQMAVADLKRNAAVRKPEQIDALAERISAANKEGAQAEANAREALSSNGMSIETVFVVYNRSNDALYVPVRLSVDMSKGEQALIQHVTGGLQNIQSIAEPHGLAAYAGNVVQGTPKVLELSGLEVLMLEGEFDDPELDLEDVSQIDIPAGPASYVKHKIMPHRQKDRAWTYFPKNKEPFLLFTPYGPTVAHVTSGDKGGIKGSYIGSPDVLPAPFRFANLHQTWGVGLKDTYEVRAIKDQAVYAVTIRPPRS